MYNHPVSERIYRGARDLGVPVLVSFLGCSLAVAGWWALVLERRDHLLTSTLETSFDSAAALSERLSSQRTALEELGGLWTRFGAGPSDEWRAAAGLLVETRPGLESITWVDVDDSPGTRATAGHPLPEALLEWDAAEALQGPPTPRVMGPEEDERGTFYRVFLPLSAGDESGEASAILVARVRVGELLGPMLQARSTGYAVTVDWDGLEIFSRGQPSPDSWQDWWRVERRVQLPLEGEWRIVHRPTPTLAAALLTPIPHYLLATGLVLSLLVGAIVHQWRVVSRQARFLEIANRALEEKGQDLERLNVELERRVDERTEQLQEVVAELEAFNYSVSHDLRSPLGAILNLSAILEEDYREQPLGDEGLDFVARIRRSASRATALLEDLLDLSRAGQVALHEERIDMTALAREIFAQARVDQADADVELVLDHLPEAWGDRALLGAVFSNLFANALKYSRGREKRRVIVRGWSEGGDCLYQVTDNGWGFDMRFAHKLFGLFERLHRSDEVKGTGVGLALVQRIVKRHRGRVWAEGEPGVGARFGFALPRPRNGDRGEEEPHTGDDA